MTAAIQATLGAAEDVERLFLAHHTRALRVAYRICGSMADAEDVVQTVFLRIVQQGSCRQAIDRPESYIYRAAIHAALDLLRQRRRQKAVPLEAAASLGGERLADEGCRKRELQDGLRQALSRLGPTAAEMFVLRYLEDYDNGQIARLLGTSKAVVAVVLYRSRARLRKELQMYLRGEP